MDWGLGRYEPIAEQLLEAARAVIDAAAPQPGERVLDVGCGTGSAALLAAERGAVATGVDPSQRLLDVAAARAASRDLDARFVPGEAGALPLADGAADVVVSAFGVIFAPDARAAAAELARRRRAGPGRAERVAARRPAVRGDRPAPPRRRGGRSAAQPARAAAVRVARARRAARAARAARVRGRDERAAAGVRGRVAGGVPGIGAARPPDVGGGARGARTGRRARRRARPGARDLRGGERGPDRVPRHEPLRRRDRDARLSRSRRARSPAGPPPSAR